MRVSTVDLRWMIEKINPLDTSERRAKYLTGDFPRSDLVKDLNKRYRWDLFFAACPHMAWSGYSGSHLDTALRYIIPDL